MKYVLINRFKYNYIENKSPSITGRYIRDAILLGRCKRKSYCKERWKIGTIIIIIIIYSHPAHLDPSILKIYIFCIQYFVICFSRPCEKEHIQKCSIKMFTANKYIYILDISYRLSLTMHSITEIRKKPH